MLLTAAAACLLVAVQANQSLQPDEAGGAAKKQSGLLQLTDTTVRVFGPAKKLLQVNRLTYPEPLAHPLALRAPQRVALSFLTVADHGGPLAAQYAAVRVTHRATQAAAYFIADQTGPQNYTCHIKSQPLLLAGAYDLTLLVAGFSVASPIAWTLGTLNVTVGPHNGTAILPPELRPHPGLAAAAAAQLPLPRLPASDSFGLDRLPLLLAAALVSLLLWRWLAAQASVVPQPSLMARLEAAWFGLTLFAVLLSLVARGLDVALLSLARGACAISLVALLTRSFFKK